MYFLLIGLNVVLCLILLWYWNTLTLIGVILLALLFEILTAFLSSQLRGKNKENDSFRNGREKHGHCNANKDPIELRNVHRQLPRSRNRSKTDLGIPSKLCIVRSADNDSRRVDRFDLTAQGLKQSPGYKTCKRNTNKAKHLRRKPCIKSKYLGGKTDEKEQRIESVLGHQNDKENADTDLILKQSQFVIGKRKKEKYVKKPFDFEQFTEDRERDINKAKGIEVKTDSREARSPDPESADFTEDTCKHNGAASNIETKPCQSEMAARNISKLIQESQDAHQDGIEARAKQKALQAIAGINIEKDKLVSGEKTDITEQQLGDWYGGCSFVMNKIGENITATKCFYTATVFDPSWDVVNHKNVSHILWTSLVYSKDLEELSRDYKGLRRLLIEIDDVANLAESRGKWNVCVAADGDINRIFSYLMQQGLAENELIKQPGRKASLWRSARCFLRLGMQKDARKLCSTILQHACDYDDTEAFEIWAFSLCATKDFDLALEKCELALNYCKDKSYRQRLEAFRSNIQTQMAVDTRQEQNGEAQDTQTTVDARKEWVTQEKKKKRKNRHVKRNFHSGQNAYPSGAPCYTPGRGTLNVARKKPEELKSTDARKLQYESEKVIYQRTRQSSVCSTTTTATDGSDFETESQFDNSEQELSSGDESFDYASPSREEIPDANVAPDIDLEEEAMQEKMSFYEQSMRFYQQNEDSTEYLGKADSDEKLLRYGIKLNMSYLHQFEDKHPDVMKRDQFYPDFLDESQLKQKLLLNPKKYIRCVIQIEGSHEAYCTPINTNDSIHIIEISGRSKIGQVFNEDEVVVEILDEDGKDKKDKRFGRVIGIWNRQHHKNTKHPVFICTRDDMESNLVRPMCKTIPKIHIIDREISQKFSKRIDKRYKIETYDYDEVAEALCNPRILNLNPAEQRSYIFLVAFISWSPRHIYPRGAIIKMLPTGLSESAGLMILNLQHDVPKLYRKATVDQIASVSSRLGEEPSGPLLQGRRDLTELNTLTIDPPDSKDLDDALSVQRIDGGYKVGVHIADVAMYVPHNSPLDDESRQRATTFYPGIRRPRNMLPEPFSTKVCSLLPDKNRLTISLFFCLTNTGRPMQMEGSNFEITSSYIRSKKQLTYDEVQDIILSARSESDNDLTKDIKTLFKVAKEVRKRRLGNAMFAMDVDWEESEQGESDRQTVEAHYLVEEFMIMANKKVAEWLLRHKFNGYSQCIPLRCQPPPSKENMEEFLQKNSCYVDILLRLQDKQLGPKKPDFHECLRDEKGKTVMLGKDVWGAMVKSPKTASEYIRKDDLHPIQLTVYQHWLAIQERAGYRCSGNLKGEEDGKHASLDAYPYTHFTSPIRRYNDLIVHRLVHAALKNKPCPYEKRDIESICVHINSVTKRAKEYEKGCKALQKAIEFKTSPRMLNCCVDDVSDRGVTLCSPWLKFVPKAHRELTFSLLDMGHKPESIEDPGTKWSKVKAIWRKRLYDFSVKPNYPPNKENEYKLNPHRGVLFLPLHEWARMLRATTDEHEEDLARAVKSAGIFPHRGGFDDVSTECRNPLKIQPNTKFSMIFSRGQQLKIQMSAAPNKGIITPKPVLYNMTNNIKFCLQHSENPVLHLYRYVTRSTCDKYQDVRSYLERWIPLILMEAATGIVRNEESCCINNIAVQFLEDRKGKFSLGIADCEIRNIELSGTVSEDTDDVSCDETMASYDWLCLKATLPYLKKLPRMTDFENLNAFWVGHAAVIKVLKRKSEQSSDGKIYVTFQLHDTSPDLPSNFPTDTRFSVEILKKSEVDRRTESFIKQLPSQSDALAAKIALNKRIPDFAMWRKTMFEQDTPPLIRVPLNRSRAHIASLRHNQDIFFDIKHDDPNRRKYLPRNNTMQQEAINMALTSRFTLIQGPPGTGKTYTGIKLMYLFDRINCQLSKEGHQKKQVLFCGPSNRSVDLVAVWMLEKMDQYTPNFIRVYGRSIEAIDFPIPGRTFLSKRSTRSSHTNEKLKRVALHHLIREKGKKYAEEINANDKFFKEHDYEPMPELVKKYVHTIREASIDEIRKYDVILCTTAVGANPKVLDATNVYQVIIDEAGMCPEPQCLVPIIATKAEQVVLIGDHMQLRPIIMCKEAALLGLEKSLFERYATTDSSKNVRFTMLKDQYRMNPEICKFPSKQFYESTLRTMPGSWRGETLRIWPQDAKGTYPHVLVHVEGEEKILTVSTEEGNEQSRSNDAEIDHVLTTYNYLTSQVPNAKIQILSQYNAQCSEIKKRLKKEGEEKAEEIVSTVVSSQGGEWNYVIFSTVRSLPEYKIENNPTLGWCKHNLGFITDRNQVNVALTRAQKGLIIIGNKNLLACDYVWKRLIQHYEQRGCIKSPEEFPPKNIRKSRQQIMEEAYEQTYRRYGDSIFEKGEATSYEGSFDDDHHGHDVWNPRFTLNSRSAVAMRGKMQIE